MLEEIFDDLIGDPQIVEDDDGGPLLMESENEDADENAQNDFVSQTLPQSDNPVQPKKKKLVKNPQPKLNAARLKGPRGLTILENVFADYKFRGIGYEKEDLDQVMKRLEHWAHRLFPKYQFDDCLEKLEALGRKKEVATYVKKIRMGLETAESAQMQTEEINDVEDEDQLAVPLDPFDDLITQQLSDVHVGHSSSPPAPQPCPPKVVLTDELRERIERNRQIALERKLARQKQRENNLTMALNNT